MKMSSLSGNGALKLLLLLTSLGHYSGLATGPDPYYGICADIAANKSVNFLLVGANLVNRLLITGYPDYLVYELAADSVHNDTINLYDVTPVKLKYYYPELFEDSRLASLIKSGSNVKAFTVGKEKNFKWTMYLKIFSPDFKQLFTYNMNSSSLDVITDHGPPITATQQFVSPFTRSINRQHLFSFVNEQTGPRRLMYDMWSVENVSDFMRDPAQHDTTCKTHYKPDTMVLRWNRLNCYDCYRHYANWNWTVSPQGWADIEGYYYFPNVTFYLFDRHQQNVSIFDQDASDIDKFDVFSLVRQKSYRDFFRCTPAPTTTTQPGTSATMPTASPQSVSSSSSSVTTDEDTSRICTCYEKPKIPPWVIILIVVILVVILLVVVFFVGYHLGSIKYSDTKPDKVASTNAASSVKQVTGGIGSTGPTSQLNAKGETASKVSIKSSMVAPSKGPEAKVQGLKM